MTNKYIFNFTDFLIEQDMSSVLGAPTAPVAAKPAIKYDFLFMTGSDDAGNSRRKYPDGSIIIEYPCYSINSEDLEKWASDNIVSSDKHKLNTPELEVRRKSIIDIVKGDRINISNDDLPFIEKLKNATSANLIGKIEPDISVIFSDGIPTTDNINVTFIKHKK